LKPDEAIYRIALDVTQCPPEESVFIDDRLSNAEAARKCGMRAIHFQGRDSLCHELQTMGVEV
jgi:putative hydrolase of the HAD superfamily